MSDNVLYNTYLYINANYGSLRLQVYNELLRKTFLSYHYLRLCGPKGIHDRCHRRRRRQ